MNVAVIPKLGRGVGLGTLVRASLRPLVRLARPAGEHPRRPVSTRWGYDRGTPVARYHIDRFMSAHAADIAGAVLEIKNRRYTEALGGGAVTRADVLDIDPGNATATIVADLAAADIVPAGTYDCVLLNETLQFVYDVRAAVGHAHRILKPGGVLLATVPCTAQIDRELPELDCWRFTQAGCRRLFGEAFGEANVEISTYGGYPTCVAGLSGYAAEELPADVLMAPPDGYVQGVCVRAVRVA